jgi:hypothetical protein
MASAQTESNRTRTNAWISLASSATSHTCWRIPSKPAAIAGIPIHLNIQNAIGTPWNPVQHFFHQEWVRISRMFTGEGNWMAHNLGFSLVSSPSKSRAIGTYCGDKTGLFMPWQCCEAWPPDGIRPPNAPCETPLSLVVDQAGRKMDGDGVRKFKSLLFHFQCHQIMPEIIASVFQNITEKLPI